VKRYIFWLISAPTLLVAANMAYACDNHDGPLFSSYSRYHPLILKQRELLASSQFKLEHEKSVVVEVHNPVILNIKYNLPASYKNATLELSSSEGIDITDQVLTKIHEPKGQLSLSYSAKYTGEHKIEIRAKATKRGTPYSLVQQVEVQAINKRS